MANDMKMKCDVDGDEPYRYYFTIYKYDYVSKIFKNWFLLQ